MTASNSRGVTIKVLKVGAAGVAITPTGATKAKPSQIATASTATMADGDMVVLPAAATGLNTIDGKSWVVSGMVADTTFDLAGSDTTADTGVFAAGASDIMLYKNADWQTLCLSSFSLNPGSPSTISTGTFCDPTASVASAVVEAGTIDIAGYIDITANDYKELLAWDLAGGQAREFRIDLPNNGTLVFKASLAQINWDVPVDGAIAWSGQLTLAGKPRHLF